MRLKQHVIKYSAIIFTLILLFYIGNSVELQELLNPKTLVRRLEMLGGFAPLAFMLLMALTVASPLPTLPLDIASGIYFGPYMGTLYSATGALCGSLISFLIARILGRSLIERFLSGHINFCTACSDKMLTGVVLFTRLIPVVSFDMVSYGAGLTKMSVSRFSLATFFGMLPLTFIYNKFGAALVVDSIVAIFLGLIMVALLFIAPLWIEKYAPENVRHIFSHSSGKRV